MRMTRKLGRRFLIPILLLLSAAVALALALLPRVIAPAVALALIVIVAAVLPFALGRPLRSPLVTPPRGRLLLPLLPVAGRHLVIGHGHQQHGPRHVDGRDADPRAVDPDADVPAAIHEGPV